MKFHFFFCPIDEKRLDLIEKKNSILINQEDHQFIANNDNKEIFFKNNRIKNIIKDKFGNIKYTENFKKSIEYFSVGNNNQTEIIYNVQINEIVDQALINNFKIFRMENFDKINSIYSVDLKSHKIIFKVGNESEGISEYVKNHSKINELYIPSEKNVDSFNVACIASLVCCERNRQCKI